MPEVAAIIFDCDGTLVDSETLANEVLCGYLTELGVSMSPATALQEFRGGQMADTVKRVEALRGKRVPGNFVEEFRGRMESAFRQRLRPMAGAHELLSSLRVPFCIASSGPRRKMAVTLAVTGLNAFFPEERIFSSYDTGQFKPDPGIFLHAAKMLRVAPSRCVVVEDSAHGIAAGLAAGMRVFALQPGPHVEPLPPSVTPLGSLTELLEQIQG